MPADAAVTREQILSTLQSVLEPLPHVYAMWQGGAIAFNRLDEWSDIDVCVDVDDDRIEETFALVEKALEAVAPIELKHRMPDSPAYSQAFYRLQGASPFLLIDLALMKHSSQDKMLERDMHGEAAFHFDKDNVARFQAFDPADRKEEMRRRLAMLRVTFPLFQVFTLKEVNRGAKLDALGYYQGFTLRPLVEVLRMRYCPDRFSFYTRYARFDLPAEVVERLETFFFLRGLEDIRAKHAEAQEWFYETVEQIRL